MHFEQIFVLSTGFTFLSIWCNKIQMFEIQGVSSYTRDNTWEAQAMLGGKRKHFGTDDNEKEAATRYNDDAIKHVGEYALLNDQTKKKIMLLSLSRTNINLRRYDCRLTRACFRHGCAVPRLRCCTQPIRIYKELGNNLLLIIRIAERRLHNGLNLTLLKLHG
jgi:hypothetical protein